LLAVLAAALLSYARSAAEVIAVGEPSVFPGEQPNDVANLAGGDFIVVFESSDGDSSGVFGRRYDPAGTVVGSEFRLNAETAGDQSRPRVAARAGGGFVATWHDQATPQDKRNTFARGFDSSATALDAGFKINTSTAGTYLADVAADGIGGFVVVWHHASDAFPEIHARYVDGSGVAGIEFDVSEDTSSSNVEPRVAALDDSTFLITWSRFPGPDDFLSSPAIRARQFSAPLVLGEDVKISEDKNTLEGDAAQYAPSVGATAAGDFVVGWRVEGYYNGHYGISSSETWARRFTSSVSPVGPQIGIGGGFATEPAVAAEDTGFVVVWSAADYDAGGLTPAQISGKRFGLQGTEAFTVAPPPVSYGSEPNVATSRNGTFFVTWNNEGSGYVRAFCSAESGALGCGSTHCPSVPRSGAPAATVFASNALDVLRAAVGAAYCRTCVCDVNGSLGVTVADALSVLKKSVGLDVTLSCSAC
jgi:hypothetical protein